MPFFKKKQPIRSDRIEELQAHVRNIRRIAAEDPRGPAALESFLLEDDSWDPREPGARPSEAPEAPARSEPRDSGPEQSQAGSSGPAAVEGSREDEEMLQAELQRYLARLAEENAPRSDDADY